jgi:predicted metal-dependent HD superfamily phosphohydrolase
VIEDWIALVGGEHARAAGLDLLARYGEPHRRYHTVRHLREVLAIVDELAAEADDPDAVRLAAWFHDAVYAIGSASNERDSAQLAEQVLEGLGTPAARICETARLVLLTASHRPERGDRNAAVLCDADLAILGAPPERYLEYAAEVRQEYAAVPDEAFRRGRAEVLRSLRDAPALFHTALARERYEERARANLAAEIAALGF